MKHGNHFTIQPTFRDKLGEKLEVFFPQKVRFTAAQNPTGLDDTFL